MRRSTLWWFLAIALPVLGALVAPLPAVDLTYQLRAGAEILDHGAIPSVDTWTFTAAGTPWLDQQWGAQVLLTLAYRLGGWTGLVVLRAALVGLAFGLLLLVIRRRSPGLRSPAAALLVIAAFLVSLTALALRPQLFAIDLFAATLLVLALRDAHPRGVWLIPLFALGWANLHGTFLLAPALCGLAWFGDLADLPASRGGARHRMLLVALVAMLATVVTPFGPAVWGYVANLTSNPTIAGRVSEWQPPSPLTVPGALVWISIVAVALLLVARIGSRARASNRLVGAIPWAAALTVLLFGGFAAVSGRGTAWWPFVAVFVVAPWLAPSRPPQLATTTPSATEPVAPATAPSVRSEPQLLGRLNVAIAALLVVAGVALLPTWRPVGEAGVPAGTLSYAPQDIAAALASLPPRATGSERPRVWNPQTWGSWLEFAAPSYRYAVDSRIELFDSLTWDSDDQARSGGIGVLYAWQVDVAVTERQSDAALDAALAADTRNWVRVVATCDGAVWLWRSSYPAAVPAASPPCP